MKRIIPFLAVALLSATAFASHKDCLDATVRISNGSGRGSGCVFFKRNGDLFILTNAHVAGRTRGNRVGVEFWQSGHKSTTVPGVVIWAVDSGQQDIAVVWVKESALGGYSPPAIPLARPTDAIATHSVTSSGCPQARWPTMFSGHVVGREGSYINVIPIPAPGRSGSPVFKDGKIVGLITLRSNRGEEDGTTGRDGYGLAQTHVSIRNAFAGKPTAGKATGYPIDWRTSGNCIHGVGLRDFCPT